MDLNLFENRRTENNSKHAFIEALKKELRKALSKNESKNELDEYNIYEKKKVFLDNKSRSGNDLAWVMDENSICISESGEGGPVSINEVNLPKEIKAGEVYEKINGKYVYNEKLTIDLDKLTK